ncbi:MAG: ABC transporter ATP-binding protein [Acidimicrobiales bacterium]
MLHVDDVTVRFGGVTAVDHVTLKVEEGQRWAVIGPNGAGKTTLFRTISGEVLPTEGRVELFGTDMSRSAPYKKAQSGVGRTYQVTELFQELTVEENIIIAAHAVTKTRFCFWTPVRVRGALDEKVSWALESVGLVSERQTRVSELSHGEQRQLEIAMGLASNPKILLLDEPAAGLSAAERKMMKDLINSLPRDLSIVLIEHDMDIALDLVEQVLVLDNGVRIAGGEPDDIRNNQRVQDVYLRFD